MSPLKKISSTCQTCHRDSQEALTNYVYQYQDKAIEIRNRVEKELSKAHIMAKVAWDKGANEKVMENALKLIRQSQWRWDFAVASHGGSFHAPVEIQRILAHSLDRALLAQLDLQKVLIDLGVKNVEMHDITSKEKAQSYIGLDMKNYQREKETWKKDVLPKWIEKAKKDGKL